ncbi:MAG: L-fucose:H+ symporter permease [Bacteroidales bacterium]|nr:L-fucose:H+ symporter permease [Bacteroidales bacterium]
MGNGSRLVERRYLLTFILITTLFALWGFANDITNPMVAAFQTIMELSAAKASLIQFAFYGGYATMAIPAALFIRKFSYKSGIILGLALYAAGAFLFIPAAAQQSFMFFCFSLYILTFGLAFLETTANPFILSLGTKDTSTRRLNLAQTFNPMGSLSGMAVASFVVLPSLLSDQHRDAAGVNHFAELDAATKGLERVQDLATIRNAYVVLGIVVLVVLLVIALTKMPNTVDTARKLNTKDTLSRLWHNTVYREGVLAQVFYVGAQIMVWTFIIQYADNLGIDKATAQRYNILAMAMFLCFRFIATMLMKYVNSRRLLLIFSCCASACTIGAIAIVGMGGLVCLVAISAFMSLMFPTIYGISLENVSAEDSTLGAAFLVMAIVGGSILPPLQGSIIDLGTVLGHPAVNVSFCLPLICFIVVGIYGFRSMRKSQAQQRS